MKKLIDQFESVADFQRKMGIPYQRASKWYQRDRIPASYWPEVIAVCRKNGIRISYKEMVEHTKSKMVNK